MDLRFVRLVVALISVQVLKKHLKLTKFWIVQSHVFFDTWKNPWSIWETQISVLLKKKNCAQLDKFNQVKLQTSHPQKVGRSQSSPAPCWWRLAAFIHDFVLLLKGHTPFTCHGNIKKRRPKAASKLKQKPFGGPAKQSLEISSRESFDQTKRCLLVFWCMIRLEGSRS